MNEQRKDVLELLAEGKITATEAERLIVALERDLPSTSTSPEIRPRGKAKYLRVLLEDGDNGEAARINVRVPLQLLRAGVQLAAVLPPRALDQVNEQLTRSGVPIDLKQLKPEQRDALVDHLDELTVEVDDASSKVRVFCE